MNTIINYLDEAYQVTKKLYQFLSSDLDFDAKIEQVEAMIERREQLFEAIEQSAEQKPACYEQKMRQILDYDCDISDMMQALLEEQETALEDVRKQKRHASQSRRVQNEYLKSQVQSGYYVNRKE